MKLVLIEWEDSHADGAWHRLDGGVEDRALACRSVGWLVLDGDRVKVVAPHINEEEPGVLLQGCGVITIPAGAVLRTTILQQHEAAYPNTTKPIGGSMEFVWTLSGNVVARMTVTGPFDSDDVKTLEDNFNAAKRALEKAARTRAVEPPPSAPRPMEAPLA